MTDFWTADKIETLRQMRANGARVRDIVAAIGASKGAVIGKMDRLGLNTSAVPRSWTPDRCDRLRALHAAGMTYEDIAAEIGGTTGRGVEKMARKLGLPRRGYYHRAAFRSTAPRQPRPKPRLVVPLVEPSKDLAASIIDATGCLWAITPDDVGKGEHRFCNHPKAEKGPYCEYHAEMSRAKPVPKAEVKRFKIPTTSLRAVA